jgi:hypothetical protein
VKREDGCEMLFGSYRCGAKPALTYTRRGEDPIRLCLSCWTREQKNFEIAQMERRADEAKTYRAG